MKKRLKLEQIGQRFQVWTRYIPKVSKSWGEGVANFGLGEPGRL